VGRKITSSDKIDRAEKINTAMQMRRDGADLRSISDALGYKSESSAHDLIKQGIAAIYRENAEELFALQLERLDVGTQAAMAAIRAGDVKAIHALVQLHDRYAKLFHLDELHKSDSNADADAALAQLNANIVEAAKQYAQTQGDTHT